MQHYNLGYPLAFLDFEASSLEEDSFPIEVGIAVARDPASPPSSWSTLILPTSAWSSRGHWSKASQRVHGISKEDLAAGMTPRDVILELNAKLESETIVWCDGGAYDEMWLAKLAHAAKLDPTFVLRDVVLIKQACPDLYAAAMANLARTATPHRAEVDALRLLQAFGATS